MRRMNRHPIGGSWLLAAASTLRPEEDLRPRLAPPCKPTNYKQDDLLVLVPSTPQDGIHRST